MLIILIIAIVVFVVADLVIRKVLKKTHEKKLRREREEVLGNSLNLDFTYEAKSLKRAEVENPKARILAVDDEPIILGSFRKILVLDGYSVDTVETGQEALGLIQTNQYDFVFTDLKMPDMDGVDVCKGVKHMRPDIDVIIITGYASVDTAVETMKYGAIDYVQKPFSEDDLLEFVKKACIKREERIKKKRKPQVKMAPLDNWEQQAEDGFVIRKGAFISKGHSWAAIEKEGTVTVGLDDFAFKVIGKINDISFPNSGIFVKQGHPLFTIKQKGRSIPIHSPVSGNVTEINIKLSEQLDNLNKLTHDQKWICKIDAKNIHNEIKDLKIGQSAMEFFQDDIEKLREFIKDQFKDQLSEKDLKAEDYSFLSYIQKLDDNGWKKLVSEFFNR